MRLDKFLTVTGTATRSEASKAVRMGRVLVDGVPAKSPSHAVDPERNRVKYFGEPVEYRRYTYIMLNKPEGYVSATEDGRDKTVLDLLPEKLQKFNLFPCGRLDKYTVGLMLLTDNGPLGHRLLAPKSHVSKTYYFEAERSISVEDVKALEEGVHIAGGYLTKPSRVTMLSENTGRITITEGKYHQIKQMLEAVDNRITLLERATFGPLVLDETLARGEWRFLTPEEIDALEKL